ncbi:MAG: Crp/Fnr family transcriptional regulator [Bacteroidetes bacterium HGW-Bacteroidetes-2]|jgi:CRP/FNR family transcriptional regulator|nr:MAG: Crp/Fnr family transcriptional regulator [Bacteroidetes bacterium HGW-Bacteroidetes-2]
MKEIEKKITFLDAGLIQEILEVATVKEFPKGTVILKEEQYVKVLPIVIEGLVKVYSRFEDRELLLYYIQPKESCIMSFSAFNHNEPSRVFATTEEVSKILLLPVYKMALWLKTYPSLNALFYHQYNLRYSELLETIHQLLLKKMDKRLFEYLVEKGRLTNQDFLKISHNQIANELGTVREVISRVMKKLETEGKVKQAYNGIQLLT